MKSLLFALLTIFFFVQTSQSQSQSQKTFPVNPEDVSPLMSGQKLPNVGVYTPGGEKLMLGDIFAEKPTVVVFFRGGWCPYCNAQLLDLRKSLDSIVESGFQLIAISPDSFEKTLENLNKNNLNFTLLSDLTREAMIKTGIAYQAPEGYKATITEYSEGKNADLLPVPSVFVVNKAGEIQFEYINPDFKTRLSSKLLINALKGISTK